MAVLERRFRRVIAAEIARASREMLAVFEASGTMPFASLDHPQRIRAIFQEIAETSITTFGNRVLSQGKSFNLVDETKDFGEMFHRFAMEFIASGEISERIVSISDTTRSQINRQIALGQMEGIGTAAIASHISKRIAPISRTRAAVIARTETHAAANFGAHSAAKASSLTMKKEWSSTNDERTRTTHREVSSEPIGMDERFKVGESYMLYPGDPAGSAKETINCRCVAVHVVDDPFL